MAGDTATSHFNWRFGTADNKSEYRFVTIEDGTS